jgi:murein DD-endopeptidase MepM/ murein hydrolase activator NlpD
LKKKYYTVFFASNRNQYSRSFQISKKEIIFLTLFGILLIGLAVVGGLRITNQEPLTRELRSLQKDQMLLKNIINDLDLSMNLDSSNTYEKFISSFYSSHNMEYPDMPPVEGFVTRRLQHTNDHFEIDKTTKNQNDVRVPIAGRVVYSGISEDLGKTIIVSHAGGFITVYGHNDTIMVNSGDALQKNQIISRVGETGKSQGPHLHFEIWKNNQILDPREIIPEYKEKDVSIRQTK